MQEGFRGQKRVGYVIFVVVVEFFHYSVIKRGCGKMKGSNCIIRKLLIYQPLGGVAVQD